MNDEIAPTYLLGHGENELTRLRHQAELFGPATRMILGQAGVRPGMRVLDLGCGAGDVALMAAEMVGPSGAVIGIDQADEALDAAGAHAVASGLRNVTFEQGDVATWRGRGPFDAVIGRFVLMHVSDPAAVIRQHATAVRPGGVVVAIESDTTATRSIPPIPLVERVLGWAKEAAGRAGAEVALGPRLRPVLAAAGLANASMLGIQTYVPPGDPNGARQLTSILHTLLPVIERTGVATAADVDLPTLGDRLATALADATFVMPTIVGAWSTAR